jgi:hypothetical protein
LVDARDGEKGVVAPGTATRAAPHADPELPAGARSAEDSVCPDWTSTWRRLTPTPKTLGLRPKPRPGF